MEDTAGAHGPQAQPRGRQRCPSHAPQRVLCVGGGSVCSPPGPPAHREHSTTFVE